MVCQKCEKGKIPAFQREHLRSLTATWSYQTFVKLTPWMLLFFDVPLADVCVGMLLIEGYHFEWHLGQGSA